MNCHCSPSCTDEQGFLFSYYYRQWGGGEATPIRKGVLIYYSSSWPRSGYRYQSGGQLLFSQEWWDLEYLEKNPSELTCEQPLWGIFAAGQEKEGGLARFYVSGIWIAALKKLMPNADWQRWHFVNMRSLPLAPVFQCLFTFTHFHFVLIGRNLTAQSIGSQKGIERGIQIPET